MSGIASRVGGGPEAASDLVAIVYRSSAVGPVDEWMLGDLLIRSRSANAAADVTGMLLYRDGRFLQVLEGPTRTVHELFARIAADPRHTEVRTLLDEPVTQRRFAAWTMGFEPLSPGHTPPPPGFRDTFADLDVDDDEATVARAVTELTVWFRTRSGEPALP